MSLNLPCWAAAMAACAALLGVLGLDREHHEVDADVGLVGEDLLHLRLECLAVRALVVVELDELDARVVGALVRRLAGVELDRLRGLLVLLGVLVANDLLGAFVLAMLEDE